MSHNPLKSVRIDPQPKEPEKSLIQATDRVFGHHPDIATSAAIEEDAISRPKSACSRGTSIEFQKTGPRGAPDSSSRQIGLILDGGSACYMQQALVVKELMRRVQTIEQNIDKGVKSSAASPLSNSSASDGKFLPCHYFDYIGGTSMGGVLAVLLGRLRMDIHDAIDRLRQIPKPMILNIFPLNMFGLLYSRKDSNTKAFEAAVEKIIKEVEGVSSTESFHCHPGGCKTLVLSQKVNGGITRPYLFESFDEQEVPRSVQSPSIGRTNFSTNLTIKDVCRATTANPKYFHEVKHEQSIFQDGSSWTNNPSKEIIDAMPTSLQNCTTHLLNIGFTYPLSSKVICCCFKQKPSPAMERSWNVGTYLEQEENRRNLEYVRIESSRNTGTKSEAWSTDTSNHNAFEHAEKQAEEIYFNKREDEKLHQFAYLLVHTRRQRAMTEDWEHFALRVGYKCSHCEEEKKSETFKTRGSLQQHMQIVHHEHPPDRAHSGKAEENIRRSQFALDT